MTTQNVRRVAAPSSAQRGTLPATGPSDVAPLSVVAAMLVVSGAGLVALGRRQEGATDR